MSIHIEAKTREYQKEGETQISALEQTAIEYKNKPTDPELLTRLMREFWTAAGQRIGKSIAVDEFLFTATEIEARAKKGQVAIFVPAEVSIVDLGNMFPKMGSWLTREQNPIFDKFNSAGWLWVEGSDNSPNRNTTQGQLEEQFN